MSIGDGPTEFAFARYSHHRGARVFRCQEASRMSPSGISARWWVLVLFLAGGLVSWRLVSLNWGQQPSQGPPPPEARLERPDVKTLERVDVKAFVTRHCTSCHNSDSKRGGLALDDVSPEDVGAHPKVWEKVVRKLAARQMPPGSRRRPDERTYDSVVAALEAELDRAAAARPNPGRSATLRRLNRTEYQNAIRDLLA